MGTKLGTRSQNVAEKAHYKAFYVVLVLKIYFSDRGILVSRLFYL